MTTGTAAPLGKLSTEAFARIVAPHLGAARDEVTVGPRAGHDAAIVKIGAGRVMAISTDPISFVPALGAQRSAWLACHLLASDLWTTGIPPAYASVDFNLAPSFTDAITAGQTVIRAIHIAELRGAVVTLETR